MNEKKIIILAVIATVALIGIAVFYLSKSATPAVIVASDKVVVETDDKQYDWGSIYYNAEKAERIFTIKNAGTQILKLSNVKTSCTCTTAQIITDGGSSPLFSMHSTPGWEGQVQPGSEAQLKVVFDQAFHGLSGIGPVERFITLSTNDPKNPKIEFVLKGNVVK